MSVDVNHRARRAEILRSSPEIRALFGPEPSVAWFGLGVMAFQFVLAFMATRLPWWGSLLLALGVGAFVMHAINCVVHECSHNLIFGGPRANKAFAILVSTPSLIPSAMAFCHYHLLHHSFFGVRGMDSDVPTGWEVRAVGRSSVRKLVWLLLLPFSYSVFHPIFVRRRMPLDPWLLANIVAVAAVWSMMLWLAGWPAIVYLLVSTYFSVGPHPAGAHILQEHVAFDGGNGMSSYYGAINLLSVNLGYHLEHHDLPRVSGWRLPLVRNQLPQFYANHVRHSSRLLGLWQFVTNPAIGLDSRPIREIDARVAA